MIVRYALRKVIQPSSNCFFLPCLFVWFWFWDGVSPLALASLELTMYDRLALPHRCWHIGMWHYSLSTSWSLLGSISIPLFLKLYWGERRYNKCMLINNFKTQRRVFPPTVVYPSWMLLETWGKGKKTWFSLFLSFITFWISNQTHTAYPLKIPLQTFERIWLLKKKQCK